MKGTGHVLLVEDDFRLARQIVTSFAELGLLVEHVADGEEGLSRAMNGEYALLILDIKLPKVNGFDICRAVRTAKPLFPIVLLTDRNAEVDRVLGFELGADDYVIKPFHMNELLARVRAKLRLLNAFRQHSSDSGQGSADTIVVIGEITIDPSLRVAAKGSSPLDLTPKEFDLLLYLMRNPNRVVSKQELLRSVWQVEVAGYEDSVVSMIRRLRAKIEVDPANPEYLHTSRAVGYCFVDPAAKTVSAADA